LCDTQENAEEDAVAMVFEDETRNLSLEEDGVEGEKEEEEAKIAAEKAKLDELHRQAPEVAIKLAEDVKRQKEEQEALIEQMQAMKVSMEENQKQNADMFAKLFTLIESRLPPPPQP
jgi:CRISPR/Cas system CSM-associated protein Csm2 small subunit